MKQFALLFVLLMLFSCADKASNDNVFHQNWEDSPVQGAFKMDDWIIWGGSVVKAEDGKYYMFASRWPKKLTMRAWITNSEIVLAVSDTPQGPYKFKQVVLPSRGKEYWDGMITHNPNIQFHDGKYILYYTGSTYTFNQPIDTIPSRDFYEKAWNNKRVGIAVADAPTGPWKRMDKPIIQPRKGMWDGAIISNPAPVIHEDGSVLMVYKSAPVTYPERNKNRKMRFGVLTANHYLGEYTRMGADNKIRIKPIETDVEDPYIWHDGTKYFMLAKCMNKLITGEKGAGFMATSKDGIEWETPDNPAAYGKTLNLSDGTKEKMKKLERPQILIENGKPTHVFFACINSKSEIFNTVRTIKK
ncbi:glycoside hydrolase family protein [uncultured Polaribacter sp.]|uniref:glycoside hydrolase family protein n=1 Tax=uncultured Polaribacter sp. TaxID=174711 RepID=UPI002636AB76|nr:glycoside hydrolase family protein [uncultured Polaribacter sp.]